MKLGELIETLQDYCDSVVGVDNDTTLMIKVPSEGVEIEVYDAKLEVTMTRDYNNVRKTHVVVILEGGNL